MYYDWYTGFFFITILQYTPCVVCARLIFPIIDIRCWPLIWRFAIYDFQVMPGSEEMPGIFSGSVHSFILNSLFHSEIKSRMARVVFSSWVYVCVCMFFFWGGGLQLFLPCLPPPHLPLFLSVSYKNFMDILTRKSVETSTSWICRCPGSEQGWARIPTTNTSYMLCKLWKTW